MLWDVKVGEHELLVAFHLYFEISDEDGVVRAHSLEGEWFFWLRVEREFEF